ncbi:MAG: WcaI family glycosyltransferase [Cytophagales bacterium]|nr:WcaI family glycosyltransferase [Cytophagales bacterium]
MRILIHGINFSPELTGIGKYTGEMGEWLSIHGHQVDVITAPPYYPEWRVKSGYRNFWNIRVVGRLRIMRGPIYIPSKITSIKRILHETSFTLSTLLYWARVLFTKYDYVIVVCPVLQSGVLPVLLHFFKKFKLIVHVQDLQVDAAKQLGMVKSSKLIQLLETVEKFIFQQADYVSTISIGMYHKIVAKGIPAEKMVLFKNWVDTEFIFPLAEKEILELKSKLGYTEDDFIVLYSGNMGEKQGLELVLSVADKCKGNSRLKFLMVGDGAAKRSLIDKANALDLKNIRFLPLVPYEELNGLLNVASVHLVLQKRGATDLVMPSKLGGIMASGGFVIVAADEASDLSRMIRDNSLGKCIEPENDEALLHSIMDSLNENVLPFKANAREFALKTMSKNAVLSEFNQFLNSKS